MSKRKKVIAGAVILAIVLVIVLAAIAIYRFLAPSNTKAEPDFGIKQNEIALIVDGKLLEEKGIVIEGKKYVPAETASRYMDQRIYVDAAEKILSYATPDGMIQADVNETTYTISKEIKEAEEPVLRLENEKLYVSLSFVVEHASGDIQEYKEPSRVVIHNDRTKTYTFAAVNGATRLRKGPGKKYAWITEVSEGTEVVVESEIKQENEYMAVTTKDGITGYIPVDDVNSEKEKAWEFQKTPEIFTQKSFGKTVCLGWHQVTNETGSSMLYSGIDQAGPMNVISPTLFALSDNKGNFTSLANTGYVSQAHARGLQVWGLINDFNDGINLDTVLGTTSIRKKLVNGLVGAAIQYDLDGINIDFENVKASSAAAYLEFLRELVLKCHANDIIVSVDAYTPAEYNSYYDLAEQGRVVDYVVLMAYDEHYAGSEESGSVSSIGFVESGVKGVLAKVPAERVIVGLPFYTRLWCETKTKNGVKVTSTAYGMSGAESVVRANDATPKWDKSTGQYYASFRGESGTYKIWLEEETSIKKKLEVVMAGKVAGVAFWKLGFERAATWLTIEDALK
ncbi:MAG: glycosyl hydrolase family 18 protein [Eubacterium sp.]|nr:glycosyl hydrolase family 18 protein [Eubacterium sp.]